MHAHIWTAGDEFLNNLIAFYRARVERVIARIKNHAWCECDFRGSYEKLCMLYDIAVIGTALEIRMEFELDSKVAFEVVGPWPHTFYP